MFTGTPTLDGLFHLIKLFPFVKTVENMTECPYTLTQRTVKNLKFGTPQTIAIIVLKKEKFDVTLH